MLSSEIYSSVQIPNLNMTPTKGSQKFYGGRFKGPLDFKRRKKTFLFLNIQQAYI